MSAGFKVAGEVFWGTNGAVEAYVEVMALEAEFRFGPDDPLTLFIRDERDSFSRGKIVFLDEWLRDVPSRVRVLTVLDAATNQLLREGTFTEYGREWVALVVSKLREQIAGHEHNGEA